jgi:hypothetical protein
MAEQWQSRAEVALWAVYHPVLRRARGRTIAKFDTEKRLGVVKVENGLNLDKGQ